MPQRYTENLLYLIDIYLHYSRSLTSNIYVMFLEGYVPDEDTITAAQENAKLAGSILCQESISNEFATAFPEGFELVVDADFCSDSHLSYQRIFPDFRLSTLNLYNTLIIIFVYVVLVLIRLSV